MSNTYKWSSIKKVIIFLLVVFVLLLCTSCNTDEFIGSLTDMFISRLWTEGQYELAMKKNDEMLSKYPKSITLLNNKAYMLMEFEEYEAALTALDRVLEVDKDNDIALNNKAWTLVMLQRSEEALGVLELSFLFGHHGSAEYNTQGNAYLELDRFDEAIESYDKALSINPKFASASYGKGAAYYEQTLYTQAAVEFEKYVDLNPSDLNGYDYLGYSYYYGSEYQKALDVAEIMIQKFPEAILGYLLKTDCLIDLKQQPTAITVLENIKDRFNDPADAENIYNRLGDLYYNTLDYGKSTEAYIKCLELFPDSLFYMVQIGYNYLELNNQTKLQETIETTLSMDPGYGEIYNLKGLNLAYQTYYKASIPEFEKALELGADQNDTALNKAWALFMSKQLTKCFDFCMEQVEQSELPLDFYLYAAYCKEYLFELDDAATLYLKALELSPDNETILSSLSSVYFEQQDIKKSLEYANKTLAVNPDNITATYLSDLIQGYSNPLSQQTAEFFMKNYLYADQIEDFTVLCKSFAGKKHSDSEDVARFIDNTKLEQDWYTYVITDSTFADQFDYMVTVDVITENIENVYYYKFRDFSYTIGYDFIRFANDIPNPEDSVLIVDLRDNGGGLIQGAVDMLDCLLGNYVVCTTIDRDGYTENYYSDADQIEFKHIYLFVNDNTASASELFTLGLKRYKNQVTVIGAPTVGKGVGQMIYMDIQNELALVTVNFYWNVKEENINQKPILPDIYHDNLHTLKGPNADAVIQLYEKYH